MMPLYTSFTAYSGWSLPIITGATKALTLPPLMRLVPNSFTEVPIFSAYLKSTSVIFVIPSV